MTERNGSLTMSTSGGVEATHIGLKMSIRTALQGGPTMLVFPTSAPRPQPGSGLGLTEEMEKLATADDIAAAVRADARWVQPA
jgi:hypothetical protein